MLFACRLSEHRSQVFTHFASAYLARFCDVYVIQQVVNLRAIDGVELHACRLEKVFQVVVELLSVNKTGLVGVVL